jgi:hypothetical protein
MTDKLQALPLLELRLKRNKEVQARAPKPDSSIHSYQSALKISMDWLKDELDTQVAIDAFYSQSFKPEMITELFEGWGFNPESETVWLKPEGPRGVFSELMEPDVFIEFGNGTDIFNHDTNLYIGATPRNIGRFIDHCYDAGLPLYLNEETRKKYPSLEY